MGSFRFRRRIKIIPGLWLNLSKSGVSTSIGGKGLTVNLKDGKTKTTIGLPGTGMSYSETLTDSHKPEDGKQPEPSGQIAHPFFWIILFTAIIVYALS
ncbi:MAG: DUF4236 domain-containing protein [Burkholderiales bacterium]|nr:DUF4236 domain-containing protein [Burkholderiales bacterium]